MRFARPISLDITFFIFFALLLHAMFRGTRSDLDAIAYAGLFKELSDFSAYEFFQRLTESGWMFKTRDDSLIKVEWGFALFSWLTTRNGYDLEFSFGAIAFSSLLPVYIALKKNTMYPVLGALWFLAFCYPNLEMSAIRAGMAAGVLVGFIGLLNTKRYFAYLVLIIVASTFHISALFATVILAGKILLRSSSLIKLFILIICIFLVGNFILTEFLIQNFQKLIEYKSELSQNGLYSSINIFNSITICMFTLYISRLFIFSKIYDNEVTKFYNFLYILPLVILFSLLSFPIAALRLFEFGLVFQIFYVSNIKPRSNELLLPYKLFVIFIAIFGLCMHQFRIQNVNLFYFILEPTQKMQEYYNLKIGSDRRLYELWLEGL